MLRIFFSAIVAATVAASISLARMRLSDGLDSPMIRGTREAGHAQNFLFGDCRSDGGGKHQSGAHEALRWARLTYDTRHTGGRSCSEFSFRRLSQRRWRQASVWRA